MFLEGVRYAEDEVNVILRQWEYELEKIAYGYNISEEEVFLAFKYSLKSVDSLCAGIICILITKLLSRIKTGQQSSMVRDLDDIINKYVRHEPRYAMVM